MAKVISRTIKLKLILTKDSEEKQALFDSHIAVNEAVAEYERVFMLMRQEKYYDKEGKPIDKSHIVEELTKYFSKNRELTLTQEQFLSLRSIYANIAAEDLAKKKLPKAQGISKWTATLFGSDTGKDTSKDEEFKQIRKEARELNLFPLFSSKYLTDRLITSPRGNTVSYWEKAALRIAAAHIISWNACNKTTMENYMNIQKEAERNKVIYESFEVSLRKKIENYCVLRKEENLGFKTEKDFYITEKMLCGFDEIIKKWGKCTSEETRLDVISTWQSDDIKKRKIGDVNFYSWLARKENVTLWQTQDFLTAVKEYHVAIQKLERLSPQAKYTFPDIVNSPRWLMYEYKGGSNLKNYVLKKLDCPNMLCVNMPLLLKNGDKYSEKEYTFLIAQNVQFNVLSIEGKKVVYSNGKEIFTGELGGADILVKMDSTGKFIKTAYLKMSVKIDVKEPYEGFEEFSRAVKNHFSLAMNKDIKKHEDKITNHPVRIMSVDLGQRSFGACSVFEIKDNCSKEKLNFPAFIFNSKISVHERSFFIRLPGEDVPDNIRTNREMAMQEVYMFITQINMLSDCLKIINQDIFDRKKSIIEKSAQYYKDKDYCNLLNKCKNVINTEEINALLKEWFDRYEAVLSAEISSWRKRTKKKQERAYYGGKSMWSIEYLSQIRRMLLKWSNHIRMPGKITRMDTTQ